MKYKNTVIGKFIERPNRFIAHVEVDAVVETVHVKNTGRCKELLHPGVSVILEISDNPKRKTKYDLICVKKAGLGWVNMDSQAPNKVVKEWLEERGDSCGIFPEITYMKPEYTYGNSRVDFYLEQGPRKCLMEVKGCTLELDGKGYFPDAPTTRGVKHLKELTKASQTGMDCYIAFVIQMNGIEKIYPNMETHREFGEALQTAKEAGVTILYLCCEVGKDELKIIKSIAEYSKDE